MNSMIQSMRWYGPNDPVVLADILQAGCEGVVTALHHIPNGEVWTEVEILKRKNLIESAKMQWVAVESLPVSEAIKTQTGNFEAHIANYKISLKNLAANGIKVITYNFMPILDWTRTDLAYVYKDGSLALHFNRGELAAFDVFILNRKGAESDYSEAEILKGKEIFESYSDEKLQILQKNIIAGLPGSEVGFSIEQFQEALDQYATITEDKLFEHLIYFLKEITPLCDQLGIQLAIHPDDPPYAIFGLPRIVGNDAQIEALLSSVPNESNGLCFCIGSLGVNIENDLPEMIRKFGNRIYFLHLRNVISDADNNFTEANHLEGNTDMYAVTKEIVFIMQSQNRRIPMRPDHGHQMLDDLHKKTNPGYSAIGRLRGLAEIRGLEYGLLKSLE